MFNVLFVSRSDNLIVSLSRIGHCRVWLNSEAMVVFPAPGYPAINTNVGFLTIGLVIYQSGFLRKAIKYLDKLYNTLTQKNRVAPHELEVAHKPSLRGCPMASSHS